jgi:hypothetical protein
MPFAIMKKFATALLQLLKDVMEFFHHVLVIAGDAHRLHLCSQGFLAGAVIDIG